MISWAVPRASSACLTQSYAKTGSTSESFSMAESQGSSFHVTETAEAYSYRADGSVTTARGSSSTGTSTSDEAYSQEDDFGVATYSGSNYVYPWYASTTARGETVGLTRVSTSSSNLTEATQRTWSGDTASEAWSASMSASSSTQESRVGSTDTHGSSSWLSWTTFYSSTLVSKGDTTSYSASYSATESGSTAAYTFPVGSLRAPTSLSVYGTEAITYTTTALIPRTFYSVSNGVLVTSSDATYSGHATVTASATRDRSVLTTGWISCGQGWDTVVLAGSSSLGTDGLSVYCPDPTELFWTLKSYIPASAATGSWDLSELCNATTRATLAVSHSATPYFTRVTDIVLAATDSEKNSWTETTAADWFNTDNHTAALEVAPAYPEAQQAFENAAADIGDDLPLNNVRVSPVVDFVLTAGKKKFVAEILTDTATEQGTYYAPKSLLDAGIYRTVSASYEAPTTADGASTTVSYVHTQKEWEQDYKATWNLSSDNTYSYTYSASAEDNSDTPGYSQLATVQQGAQTGASTNVQWHATWASSDDAGLLIPAQAVAGAPSFYRGAPPVSLYLPGVGWGTNFHVGTITKDTPSVVSTFKYLPGIDGAPATLVSLTPSATYSSRATAAQSTNTDVPSYYTTMSLASNNGTVSWTWSTLTPNGSANSSASSSVAVSAATAGGVQASVIPVPDSSMAGRPISGGTSVSFAPFLVCTASESRDLNFQNTHRESSGRFRFTWSPTSTSGQSTREGAWKLTSDPAGDFVVPDTPGFNELRLKHSGFAYEPIPQYKLTYAEQGDPLPIVILPRFPGL